MLTDARGFPLMVEAFEGNKAEPTTIISSTQAFQTAHRLADVTVAADAGMLSDGNLRALSGAGLRFIVGQKIPEVPYVVRKWMDAHPGQDPPSRPALPSCSPPSPWPTTWNRPPAKVY